MLYFVLVFVFQLFFIFKIKVLGAVYHGLTRKIGFGELVGFLLVGVLFPCHEGALFFDQAVEKATAVPFPVKYMDRVLALPKKRGPFPVQPNDMAPQVRPPLLVCQNLPLSPQCRR